MPSLRARKIRARYDRRAPPMDAATAAERQYSAQYAMSQMDGLPLSERRRVWETGETSPWWDAQFEWDDMLWAWRPREHPDRAPGYYPSGPYPRETLRPSPGLARAYPDGPVAPTPAPRGGDLWALQAQLVYAKSPEVRERLIGQFKEIEHEIRRANEVETGRPGGDAVRDSAGPCHCGAGAAAGQPSPDQGRRQEVGEQQSPHQDLPRRWGSNLRRG